MRISMSAATALALVLGVGQASGGVLQIIAMTDRTFNAFRFGGLSRDGSAVTGYSIQGDYAEPFRWTQATGLENLGILTPGPNQADVTKANGISDDGDAIIGYDFSAYGRSFIWREATGMAQIHSDFGQGVTVSGISGDGKIVYGSADTADGRGETFRWTEADGYQPFSTGLRGVSRVSYDGSTIIGGNQKWKNGVVSSLPFSGNVSAINEDASVIVGANNGTAFRWTETGGVTTIGAGLNSLAVTSDGSAVFGRGLHGSGLYSGGFVWDEVNGARDLLGVLTTDHALDFGSWQYVEVLGMSGDGTRFVLSASGVNLDGDEVTGLLLAILDRPIAPTAVVPEPATWGMWLVFGSVAFGLIRRSRRPAALHSRRYLATSSTSRVLRRAGLPRPTAAQSFPRITRGRTVRWYRSPSRVRSKRSTKTLLSSWARAAAPRSAGPKPAG